MINFESIPDNEQASMLSSFWTMLKECEAVVENSKDKDGVYHDPVLKHWVEQWHTQWNRVTNSNTKPAWAQ